MSNEYYAAPIGPVDYTRARAALIAQQFLALQSAFDKIPTVEEFDIWMTRPQDPQGPPGDKGDKGDTGGVGLSAYAVAVANGFVGTQSQWLASLVGAPGTNGTNGTNGNNGLSAYQIAVNNGFVGTEMQWLASLHGADGTGSSWNDLADRPASLVAIGATAGVANKVPYFTDPSTVAMKSVAELFSAMDASQKTLAATALGMLRVSSALLDPNAGYLEFLLPGPDGYKFIIQWGQKTFPANSQEVTVYPKAYQSWSIAVVSSANPVNEAHDNAAGTTSCGTLSFAAYSALDIPKPGFWIAVGV